MQNSPAFWSGKTLGKIYVRKGPDVVANCQTNVTIYVEVYGDTEGHRFQWEQINGSSVGVTYTTPLNEFTLSYINVIPPGVRDDKKFRFWVNKGSSKQEYYDINVFASPVELPVFSSQQSLSVNITSTTPVNRPGGLNAWISMGKIYNYSTNQEISGMFLEWKPPTTNHDLTRFIKYQPQKYVNGEWIDIYTAQVDYTGTYFIPLVEKNYNYRVLAVYRAYNTTSEIFKLSSNVTWWVDENVTINPHIHYASDNITFPLKTPQSVVSSLLTYSVTNQLIVENFEFKDLKSSVVSDFMTFVKKDEITPENLQMLPRQGNDLLNSVLTISVAGNTNIGNIGG